MTWPSLNLFGRLWLNAQRLNVLSSKDVKVVCGPCTRQTFLNNSACTRQHINQTLFMLAAQTSLPHKLHCNFENMV